MSAYAKGYQRENKVLHQLQKEGYFVIRSAGSHSFADLLAIAPIKKCAKPDHFSVRFIQIKVDSSLKKDSKTIMVQESPIGLVNLELWKFRGKRTRPQGRTSSTNKKKILPLVSSGGRRRKSKIRHGGTKSK